MIIFDTELLDDGKFGFYAIDAMLRVDAVSLIAAKGLSQVLRVRDLTDGSCMMFSRNVFASRFLAEKAARRCQRRLSEGGEV